MDKRIRTTLLFLSSLFFVVAAPVVVLYAIGYRFVPSDNPTVPVGVLFVESIPRGARMYVDGKLVGTTPEAVSSLKPGDVHVRLEKEGYGTWEKTVSVQPTRTTEFRTVKLFATDEEPKILRPAITSFSVSPSREIIATVAGETLQFLDGKGEMVFDPILLDATPDALLWSPDSASILLQTNSTYSLVTLGIDAVEDIPSLDGAKDVVWDIRLPGRLLARSASGDLISYATATEELQIIAENIGVFAPTSRNIIAVTQGDGLAWYSLQGSLVRTRSVEDVENIVKLQTTPAGNIALQYNTGAIDIITSDSDRIQVDADAQLVGWSPDGKMLLLQISSTELAVFNVENNRATHIPLQKAKSIIRLSRAIRDPQWFAGGTHVIFQIEDQIVISEVDTRDHPIQFMIDSTNTGDATVAVGEDGYSVLYKKVESGVTNLIQRVLVLPSDQ